MEKKSKFFYGWIIIACLFAIAMFPMAYLRAIQSFKYRLYGCEYSV